MKVILSVRRSNCIILLALLLFLLAGNGFSQKSSGICQDKGLPVILNDSAKTKPSPVRSFSVYIKTDSVFSFRSLKGYFPALLNDFVSQASAPFHFGEKQWLITGISAGVTWVLMKNDDDIDQFAKVQKQDHKLVDVVSPKITRLGGDIGLYSVIGAGVASYFFKDRKGFQTCLLSSQAIITSGIWVRIVKLLSGRERPFSSYAYSKTASGHWYGPFAMIDQDLAKRRPGSSFDSFPSGHAATAFSIASVVATQYKDVKAIPIISYSLASLVGVSRLTEHEHWASDVLVGALIGFACGKQVVSAYNRIHYEGLPMSSVTSKKRTQVVVSGSGDEVSLYVLF